MHPRLSREHRQQPVQDHGNAEENAANDTDDSDSDEEYVLEVSDEE